MSTPISLRGLSKNFGLVVAVDQVDLDIPAGALFFLLGPSGCGKTTLLRMIAGFAEPSKGTIAFGERDVTHVPANQRHCGMVFQSYALWPHLTVRQNVAFGLEVRRLGRAQIARRVDQALESVQMLALAKRKPNELSGGQQQRVALARAMVIEPTVLLLDEPLSNLDAKLRLEMRGQIRQICKDAKITAVYVTHDQKEALSMADAMAVLRDGKIVQAGGPRELYDRPANRFVADFLGETNFVPATVTSREGTEAWLESSAGRLRSTSFPDSLRQGDQVVCSIRPEAVRLLPESFASPHEGNLLQATRVESVFLGEMAQHQLLLRDKVPLKVFELNPRSQGTETSAVRLSVLPQDVVVLTD